MERQIEDLKKMAFERISDTIDPDHLFKLVIAGDSGVGKSNLLRAL